MSKIMNEFQKFKKDTLEKTRVKSVTLNLKDGKTFEWTASEFFDQIKEWLMEGMMMQDHMEALKNFFLEA